MDKITIAANSRCASCVVSYLISSVVLLLGFSGGLAVKCFETCQNAKPETVVCSCSSKPQ